MDKAARFRWTVLGVALTGTVAAILYPVEDVGFVPPAMAAIVPRPAAPTIVAAAPAHPPSERDWVANDDNPFTPRLWQAPPPPPPEAARTVVAVETGEAPPPPPPPLPYAFIGQMADEGKRVVYLGRGEQLLLAHDGDVLEGTYKVVEIGQSHIAFETVATGLRQTLPIPAQNKP